MGKKKKLSVFRAWTRKSPIIAGLIILGIYFGCNFLSALLKAWAGVPPLGGTGTMWDFNAQIIDIAWPLIIVIVFGYLWIYGRKGFGKVFGLAVIMIVIFVIEFLAMLAIHLLMPVRDWTEPVGILLAFVVMFGIGFREESLFRGVVATGIGMKYARSRGGIWFAVFMSGLLFGALHLINFMSGMNPMSVMIQAVGAVGMGMFLTAVYYRGANIWALMFLHILTNLPGLFQTLFTNTEMTAIDTLNQINPFSLIVVGVELGITVFLLRGSKIKEITDNFSSMKDTDLRLIK